MTNREQKNIDLNILNIDLTLDLNPQNFHGDRQYCFHSKTYKIYENFKLIPLPDIDINNLYVNKGTVDINKDLKILCESCDGGDDDYEYNYTVIYKNDPILKITKIYGTDFEKNIIDEILEIIKERVINKKNYFSEIEREENVKKEKQNYDIDTMEKNPLLKSAFFKNRYVSKRGCIQTFLFKIDAEENIVTIDVQMYSGGIFERHRLNIYYDFFMDTPSCLDGKLTLIDNCIYYDGKFIISYEGKKEIKKIEDILNIN